MLNSLVGWHLVLLLGLVVLPIAAVVFLLLRARKARAGGRPTPVVSLTLTLASFYAAICVIGAVWGFAAR